MKLIKYLLAGLAALALASCGGGGGSAGTPGFGGGGGGGGTGTNAPADLVLVLSSSTVANSGLETVTATVTAVDANRNTVAGVPVSFSVDNNAILSASESTTDTAGRVTATVGIGSDSTLRTITVRATSGDVTRTAALLVQAGSGASGQASLALASSSSTVTAAVPVTVTATLRDAQNLPISGRVVLLSSVRGLSTLSANSALTNAAGVVTVTVRPSVNGASGADEIQATASVQTTSGTNVAVTSSVGLEVTGASPTLAIALSPSTPTIRASTSPVEFSATVRNEAGEPIPNHLVSFSSAGGLLRLTPTTALTDATGRAVIRIAPSNPSTSAATVLSASTTVSGRDLQSNISVEIVGETPSVALTLSNSTVTGSTPATVSATVRNAAGSPVPGVIVSFASQFSLGQFTPLTAVTNDTGVATSTLAVRAGAASGADSIIASTTVAGQPATQQATVQFVTDVVVGSPDLAMELSRESISAAEPADVTITLRNAAGEPVAGQVVTFNVVRALATTNVRTALTNATGTAVVRLVPATSASAGADEINASVTYAGTTLQRTRGFQVLATPVTLTGLEVLPGLPAPPLSAYGQTTLRLVLSGASVTAPTAITLNSSCLALGKAVISPTSFTATADTVEIQYRDNGCGALQDRDRLSATVTATGASTALELPIVAPAESSIAFVQAAPEQIFLRGSGFAESSVVTFEVRDAAGNPLPNRNVELRLTTGAGGVTMEGRGVESVAPPSASPFVARSDAGGKVSVRVNSGTLPTPVRIDARLEGVTPTISTVSSNLSVAVGLPSQLNFSLSQQTINIEGYNVDGNTNTYQIIAADRSGNPVPEGTSINFVTEGGQIEAIKLIQHVNGIARTTANFVTSSPRPIDGRITITSYALGEESFLDLNGDNAYTAGEPFQDLGNVFRDRNLDGTYDPAVDEFIPLEVNNSSACAAPASSLLRLDPSIPSQPSTCDGRWSGAGQVYVRRAIETVLATSSARPLWSSVNGPSTDTGLDSTCVSVELQTGRSSTDTDFFVPVGSSRWYDPAASGFLSFIVADANPGAPGILPRLNPMAAGTTIAASSPTDGLAVTLVGGSVVPNTSEASSVGISYNFENPALTSGLVTLTLTSPRGLATTVTVDIRRINRPSTCTP